MSKQIRIKTLKDQLTSWEIPTWDKTGHILVTVKRERVFDVDATVPLNLSATQKRSLKTRGKLLNCRFRLRIEKINTQGVEPELEDKLLELGWYETTVIPILPWMGIVDAVAKMLPALKNNTAIISIVLEDLQSGFEKLE